MQVFDADIKNALSSTPTRLYADTWAVALTYYCRYIKQTVSICNLLRNLNCECGLSDTMNRRNCTSANEFGCFVSQYLICASWVMPYKFLEADCLDQAASTTGSIEVGVGVQGHRDCFFCSSQYKGTTTEIQRGENSCMFYPNNSSPW